MVAPYIADEVKHPIVTSAPVALDVFDRAGRAPAASQREKFGTTSPSELIEELDGAAEWLGVQVEEILLAALGRTFGRTRGDGAVAVDVTGGHRWLCHPVTLLCAESWPMGPTEMLQGAHGVLASASGHPVVQSEILLNVNPAALTGGAATPALELRVQRVDGTLHLDWWYDPARLDSYSVEEMAEQFPLALIEITSDAGAPL